MSANPDFYLTSNETSTSFQVRACYLKHAVKTNKGRDGFLVRIDPLLINQTSNDPIENVILLPRYLGDTLVPFSNRPINVYVCQYHCIEDTKTDEIDEKDISIYLWGMLFQKKEDANNATQTYFEQLQNK